MNNIALFKTNIKIYIFLGLAFFVNNAIAAQCGVFQVLQNKSHGNLVVSENICDTSDLIALGAVIELPPNSRLWLKSNVDDSGMETQIICQSYATSLIKLTIASEIKPWVQPSGNLQCNSWAKNRLTCNSDTGQKNSFFCAVSETNRADNDTAKMQRTTSVKVRSIKLSVTQPVNDDTDGSEVKEILSKIKDQAALCRDLFHPNQEVEFAWELVDGEAVKVTETAYAEDKDFSGCVKDVVIGFDYPQNLNKAGLVQTF